MSFSEDPWSHLPSLMAVGNNEYVRVCDSCAGESDQKFDDTSLLLDVRLEWVEHLKTAHHQYRPNLISEK